MSSSTGIVEFRDKGFVLDLKIFFTIVDCFSGRFPLRFFTVKLFYFIGFLGLSLAWNVTLCLSLSECPYLRFHPYQIT